MHVSISTWALTLAFLAVLVIADLAFHRRTGEDHAMRESIWATTIWTAIGLAFTGLIAFVWSSNDAGQYITGYLLERTLSIDNVFVFVLILESFAVPASKQHSALLWGSIGALVLRAAFIAVGVALLDNFSWTIYIFGIVLIYTAVSLLRGGDEGMNENSLLVRLSRKMRNPMFAVFAVIGVTDLVFAVDSIPAVFAVTRETYLVFSANAFAVLGLRPLATLLAGIMHRFVYLKPGLAIVLALIGTKMLTEHVVSIPTWMPLMAIVLILGTAIGASLFKTRHHSN